MSLHKCGCNLRNQVRPTPTNWLKLEYLVYLPISPSSFALISHCLRFVAWNLSPPPTPKLTSVTPSNPTNTLACAVVKASTDTSVIVLFHTAPRPSKALSLCSWKLGWCAKWIQLYIKQAKSSKLIAQLLFYCFIGSLIWKRNLISKPSDMDWRILYALINYKPTGWDS